MVLDTPEPHLCVVPVNDPTERSMMTDPRHVRAVCDFAVERLVNLHSGWLDNGPPEPGLPEDLRIVTIGDAAFYVGSDPGDPSSERDPDPEVVLLSSCAAVGIDDLGAAEAVVHRFRSDPDLPADLRISTTGFMEMQVWLDRPLPATISFEVVAANLDEFVAHALRLHEALAPLDVSTSAEALERAESGLHSEPVSWDLIDSTEWRDHPWLSRLERNTDLDGYLYLCLYDLSPAAAAQFSRMELQYEHADGTWTTLRIEIPGPPMPARNWQRPSVAWPDWSEFGNIPGDPKRPTRRWRARVPTGWTGPPV